MTTTEMLAAGHGLKLGWCYEGSVTPADIEVALDYYAENKAWPAWAKVPLHGDVIGYTHDVEVLSGDGRVLATFGIDDPDCDPWGLCGGCRGCLIAQAEHSGLQVRWLKSMGSAS